MLRRYLLVVLFVLSHTAAAQPLRPPSAAIAAAHPAAVAAGREILDAGGNAFDAAVAVTAALAVVEPYSSGLGGGGFFLLHRARDGHAVMIDARERAPGAARPDMYLDEDGKPLADLALDGPLAAAIPGLPAGMAHVAERYGALKLARSVAPAVRLAREGFAVTPRYQRMAQWRRDVLVKQGASAIFLAADSVPPLEHVVRQPDLARTLERFGHLGGRDFYEGDTARRLVQGVRAAGGIWTLADLKQYRALERAPLHGTYRGARIVTASLPSSGGIVMLGALGILGHLSLDGIAPAERTHLITEAMRRAYRDRAVYLGDPEFVEADIGRRLLDPQRLKEQARGIDPAQATPSADLPAGKTPALARGQHTTHFSIIDTAGNRVAATLTINTAFGSGFVPAGTGVLLNNEMDDFAIAPNTPNAYGLIGGAANAIAPGKRPLSNMTPTFIETPDRVVVLGTPGGSRIISMVLLSTLDAVHRVGDVGAWVARPRFHHQYLPDRLDHEPDAFSAEETAALARMGHTVRATRGVYGNMQAVAWDRTSGQMQAAADPRGEGAAIVFTPRAPKRQRAPARAATGR